MKTKTSKKAWSLFLALALVVTTVFGSVTAAKADTSNTIYYASEAAEAGVAGEEKTYDFTQIKSGALYVDILVPAPIEMTLTLYDSEGNPVSDPNNPLTIVGTDWIDMGDGTYGFPDEWPGLKAGDYTYGVTVAEDSQYLISIYAPAEKAKISQDKATITVGYTKKLSVENGKVEKWSTNDKKVATVDSKGKVTAKKKGKTTITAKLEDGSKVKCTVTVKDNKYSDTKITTSDVYYGEGAMKAYSASFDKSGNLVIKATFVNNMPNKVTQLKNIKITVKDGNGKTVGTYKLSTKNVSISANSAKNFSFTIKKADLKKKTADLRNCSITCDGSYIYVR